MTGGELGDEALSTVVAKSNGRNSGAIGSASNEASVSCLMVLGNQPKLQKPD